MIKIKKFQKPIDIDAHLKYICPNKVCGQYHWISLLETKTKNFRIVCYCGTVFRPKLIKTIKIKYDENTRPSQEKSISDSNKQELTESMLNTCIDSLIDYGFTKQEASNLIKQAYIINPTDDQLELIKTALKSFGENNG